MSNTIIYAKKGNSHLPCELAEDNGLKVNILNNNLTVNTISGFSTENTLLNTNNKIDTTNGKLDTIHADLDGLTYNGDNLNVNIASGTISIDNVNINASNGDNLTATGSSLNTNITNSSLNNHMYASSNSTIWHHVKCDANGILNIHSMTQDGDGTDITSTLNGAKQSLDVNVSNTVPISSVNNLNVNINDFAGNSLTSDTFTFNGSPKNGLDVAIINNSSNAVPVSGNVGISGSVSVSNMSGYSLDSSITTTNDKLTTANSTLTDMKTTLNTIHADLDGLTYDGNSNLNVKINNASPVAVSGDINSRVYSSGGSSIDATYNSLNTFDYNINNCTDLTGYAIRSLGVGKFGGVYKDLTTTTEGYLNTKITNTTTQNTKQPYTNTESATGLNMYIIAPKQKSFIFNAYTNNTGANASISAIGNTQTFSALNWGISNLRNWYCYRTGATVLSFTYSYIDGLGNEIDVSTPVSLPLASTYYPLTGSSIISTVNSFKLNSALGTTDTFYICSTNNINASWCGGNYLINTNSLWTCPNNCIAWVSNISYYSPTADNPRIFKWDTSGNRSILYGFINASNFTSTTNNDMSGFGGFITAGETIGWGGENSTTSKNISANIICRYF